MSDLERLLEHTSKPDPPVPKYKSHLKQALMDRYGPITRRSFGRAFLASSALSFALFVVLVAFVVNPQWPQRINRLFQPQSVQITDSNPPQNQSSIHPASSEFDRRLVNQWLVQQYDRQRVQIAPKGEELLAVRRYDLTNGRQVLVYTSLDHDGDAPNTVH